MSPLRLKFLTFRVYRFADASAFKQLHQAYWERIRRFLTFKLPRTEDVDETASEVFLRAWEYMTSQPVHNVTGFFYRIAKNLVADFYRKGDQTTPLTPAIEDKLSAPGSLVKELEIKETAEHVYEQMHKVREEYRDILLLRYQDEMSIEEIAEILNKTPNSVRVQLFRAREALKKKVENL